MLIELTRKTKVPAGLLPREFKKVPIKILQKENCSERLLPEKIKIESHYITRD